MNNDESHHLFAEAMRGVRPLKDPDTVLLKPKRKTGKKTFKADSKKSDQQTDHPFSLEIKEAIAPHEVVGFKRPGFQERMYRKLRAGRCPPEATLDLHGVTVQQAADAIFQFIKSAVARHRRVVKVVHGKGLHSSPQPALLKSLVAMWLSDMPEVLAFHSAPASAGGTGAVLVFLKNRT